MSCGFWFQVEPVLVFTCFVLTDCVVGLVEIEFLLPPVTSVASENSSGIAIEDGVGGNAVGKEVIGVQASESFVEPVRASTCFVLADYVLDLLRSSSSCWPWWL